MIRANLELAGLADHQWIFFPAGVDLTTTAIWCQTHEHILVST